MRIWHWSTIEGMALERFQVVLGQKLRELSGTVSRGYLTTSVDAAYTASWHDETLLVDATGGAVTVTLPAAASNKGLRLVVKKIDASANAVTVDGNSSETIDGAATVSTTTQYDVWRLHCDGAAWHLL